MKKALIILSAIALLGCNHAAKKQAKTAAETTAIAAVLQADTLQFLFDAEGEDFSHIYSFLTQTMDTVSVVPWSWNNIEDDRLLLVKVSAGDMFHVEWENHFVESGGDPDTHYEIGYMKSIKAVNAPPFRQITGEDKICSEYEEDGNISIFRKKYAKPLKYTYTENYTEGFLDEIYKNVEYYLANSKQESIVAHISDPATEFSYSIEETSRNGQRYFIIGISNEFENHTNIIQWIYLSHDLQNIYEYDLPDDKLVKFKQ